ncbi:putative sulfate/molybdate transporter [Halorussus gelatinilyticus]|uniref:Putative sulfate/molybdate transporter n=1 Tax=Halorussus gelatinilyticus TaxID=2937524 RepID=A0A8U0IIW8_9EURY|nr:putative sulfate/molybdate transporter [Halorussus gelatinilyticus]UPW00019.1 putative sulfate/molybdate transporter [Halorussus gelatinilyticus]
MEFSTAALRDRTLAVEWGDATGAVGDSVTVLPVVVAVSALTELRLPVLLLWFGAFQVVWGLRYGAPVSVEPMKALAALVIAGSLSVPELAVAGTLAGAVLLGLGSVGALGALADRIDLAVIRGVQLAVALVLARTGLELGAGAPTTALAAAAVGGAVVALGYRRAAALSVLAVGLGLAAAETGAPSVAVPAFETLPKSGVAVAAGAATGDAFALTGDALAATGAQLAMTVGNAAVATSLLLGDLFDAEVSPDELATSMGAMNLLAVPLGALPMCHGSGGVAGKHAFGARTAGANLILGGLYVVAALGAAELVAAFPMSALGVVLALVAVELGKASLDTDSLALTAGVGVLGVATNVGAAFVAGVAASAVLARVRGAETE